VTKYFGANSKKGKGAWKQSYIKRLYDLIMSLSVVGREGKCAETFG
jgi:hypothetical protein